MARKVVSSPKSPAGKSSSTKPEEATTASSSPRPAVQARPPARSASSGGLMSGTLMFRLLFLLVPLVQMLWTAEAPLRPFAGVRDPATGIVGDELIIPRILLVAAHPHDALLFAPTVLSLLSPEKRDNAELFALVVAGGETKSEWANCWDVLGLEKGKRFVLDVLELEGTAKAIWDPSVIAKHIEPFVLEHGIDTVLSFDSEGITGNPQHQALSSGLSSLVASPSLASALAAQPASERNPTAPRLFVLVSRPWWRNFSVLTPIIEHIALGVRAVTFDVAKARAEGTRAPTFFVSDVKSYGRAWRALSGFSGQFMPRELAMWVLGRSLWANEWVEV
ncbi:hypothetical protein M0805_001309 [Coniferiporia weirii]|nr:hypothetical protein M0805_001309 [Coniferiporia weirii]